MTRYYSVPEVVRMMGWEVVDMKLYQRYYQRVYGAIGRGDAGDVGRVERSFVLTKANVKRLMHYLRTQWPEDVPA
jgi:hypothetical protein